MADWKMMRTPKAYTSGYTARKNGAHPADNPYTVVKYRAQWNDGWAVADQEEADAAPAVVKHHTVTVTTQSPPTVRVQNEELGTLSVWQKSTNLRNTPCPSCGRLRCTAEGITHASALATRGITRHVAYIYCRECDYTAKLPVRAAGE